MRAWRPAALVATLAALAITPAVPVVAQAPRTGGTLNYVVEAEPPSFDAHRETTFAMLHPIRPHYNLMVKFDLPNYPKVVGDLAESWTISKDGKTYTFKIRQGVKFHDGSALTSADIKASYDKIIFPPEGIISARKTTYHMVKSVTAPDPQTVVFQLKFASPGFLENLASPFNWIYKAEILARDPRFYERNVMGTGPFRFVEYVRGSHWAGRRNPDYFVSGRPYLDGYRALFIGSPAAQVAAIRSGQALMTFRGVAPAQRDELVQALGDRITIQEGPWLCNNTVIFNPKRKPFDDVRFRKALTLGIDRWGGSKALAQIAFLGPVGAVMRPDTPFAMKPDELTKLAGYSRNITAAREEARKLLREANIPEGFSFTLQNRNIQMPYEPVGIFLVDQWRQIGLNVRHVQSETGPYFANLRAGNFEAGVDFSCDFVDDPDIQLNKFLSADISPVNYGGYIDRQLDLWYFQQSRTTDPAKRKAIVQQFEKRVLSDQVYTIYVLWWARIVPHWRQVRGYKIGIAHHLEPDLQDMWLSE
jgi:peptide/nickel transport system substrate-binding protein